MRKISQVRESIKSGFDLHVQPPHVHVLDRQTGYTELGEMKEGNKYPGDAVQVHPALSTFEAHKLLLTLFVDMAEADTRRQVVEIIKMAGEIVISLANVAVIREVQMYDCPHCKGVKPEGVDMEDTPDAVP